MSRYEQFDRSRLRVRPLGARENDLTIASVLRLDDPVPKYSHPDLPKLADRMAAARKKGAAILLMMGAHLFRKGCSRFIVDLMERKLITHVAMNGAGPIHDYEMSLVGATTESVAKYIRTGEFGLWRETGRMNDVIRKGDREGLGLGEALGRAVEEGRFPHRDASILAAGWRLGVPVTVHVGIGYDILHEHPNCDGAALGSASYRDFLIFARSVQDLEGGVMLNFGTAVMGPEVYLKALSMARNVARQEGREIRRFATAVFDLHRIEGNFRSQADKGGAGYYFRPWKTVLVRTVADGGESFYFCGDHRATFPNLARLAAKAAEGWTGRANVRNVAPRKARRRKTK